MRRRQLYALEAMEMEQAAEIDRQKRIQAEINARNIEHAKQQAGITFEYRHERFDAEGNPYIVIETKPPYQISLLGTETLPEPVVTPNDETAFQPVPVEAQAAPKRRGRPPKVR